MFRNPPDGFRADRVSGAARRRFRAEVLSCSMSACRSSKQTCWTPPHKLRSTWHPRTFVTDYVICRFATPITPLAPFLVSVFVYDTPALVVDHVVHQLVQIQEQILDIAVPPIVKHLVNRDVRGTRHVVRLPSRMRDYSYWSYPIQRA